MFKYQLSINSFKYLLFMVPILYKIILLVAIANFFIGCEESVNDAENFTSLNVDVRMEVQILDSTYQQYKRPFTKIYFTTYKLNSASEKEQVEQSDTTSCPNGWGVKLLNYTLKSEKEKIILGAACENYDGKNYREIIIDYAEAERRIDSLNHASVIKTFAIYYK
ncbi:MAG: hypothetical protein KDC90_04595 [Ignavibacteriae bacterium]|nr:hypothetical protein [Ignavibacteriota bacterium]